MLVARLPNQPASYYPLPGMQLHKQRDQEVSGDAEAEVVLRAVCATKLPTLTFEDNAR